MIETLRKAKARLRESVLANRLLGGAARAVFLRPGVRRWLRLSNGFPMQFDYRYDLLPRYGHGKPPHARLLELIAGGEARYLSILKSIAAFNGDFVKFDARPRGGIEPAWANGWLPALDGMTIYSLISAGGPRRYMEVGSGNSTKFAYRAKRDHRPELEIVSIDPHPRAEIDGICDQIVRRPLEHADLSIFQKLQRGDVLFVDNSHRSFTNSDVTVFFLEVLPALAEGVVVGIHDICLPYDYPPEWRYHYYNEQYLLACSLLAESSGLEILLPSYYLAAERPELLAPFDPVFQSEANRGVERHGCAFWMRVTRKRFA